jgi:hypothetical protein
VSCYVERRQPPDVFPDGLNCILNFCDCSVVVVGGERLPYSSINSVLASPASSHISLLLVALLPSLLFYSAMGKNKKGASSSHHSGDKRKREPTPPSEDFGDSEYLEEEFSSESEGSPVHASPLALSDDSDDSRGSPRRCGLISEPSSVPGSRARMSRRSPRTRRTPRTRPRRAAVTVMARATTTTEATAMAMATARSAEVMVTAWTAVRAATRSVARRHWF